MKCLKNKIYTDRETSLDYVEKLLSINSNREYTYKLKHEYDISPLQTTYIKSYIDPITFELLLAYILFEGCEIDETYAYGQDEIAIPILNKLYGADVLETKIDSYDNEFDLYLIWEKWCGLYNKVRDKTIFKRDGLYEELKKIIN